MIHKMLLILLILFAPSPIPKNGLYEKVSGKKLYLKEKGKIGRIVISLLSKGEYECGGWKGTWKVYDKKTIIINAIYSFDSSDLLRWKKIRINFTNEDLIGEADIVAGDGEGTKYSVSPD